ncbi:MAG: hypothetical protein IKT01_04850 [Eubacteriaceae bacterium]|nr:hypothetical protein [Eubacteriaceae bacterium]
MKRISALILTMLLAACISGCLPTNPPEPDIPQEDPVAFGTWQGNVFTSEFMGLTFTLPSGLRRAESEFIAQNPSNVAVYNMDTVLTEEILADSGKSEYYDIMLADKENAVCLAMYIIDTNKSLNAKLSASNYALNLRTALTGRGYSLSDSSHATIAEEDYISFTASLNDYVNLNYYIGKNRDYIVVWMTSTYQGQQPDIGEFLASITKLVPDDAGTQGQDD